MASDFVSACRVLLERDSKEDQSPKKRSLEDQLVHSFIKKHKAELGEIMTKVEDEEARLEREEAERQQDEIRRHLRGRFPDEEAFISNLSFEVDNEGDFHDENYTEYIGDNESRDDLLEKYPRALDKSLSVKCAAREIFGWEYEGSQEWDDCGGKVSFYHPEEKMNLRDRSDNIEELGLDYAQVLRVCMEVLGYLFDVGGYAEFEEGEEAPPTSRDEYVKFVRERNAAYGKS